LPLVLRVSDGSQRAAREARLVVYEPDRPLTVVSKWKPALPPVPWRAWMEQGFGFLVLLLVHAVGMNTLAGVERWSGSAEDEDDPASTLRTRRRRFAAYRTLVRLATLGAMAGLAVWLWHARP
jgi:hypothetical protein